MTRPMYENGTTLRHEQESFAILEKAWNCVLYKLPISYGVDAMAERDGRLVGWIEFKARKCNHDTFPTLVLSVLKVKSGLSLFETTGAPFILAINYFDGLRYCKITREDAHSWRVAYGGRTKATRDNADIEPVIHIPRGRLAPLSKGKP